MVVLSAHQDIIVDKAAVINRSGDEEKLALTLRSISVDSLQEPMKCC
jgi:hypothetical protein